MSSQHPMPTASGRDYAAAYEDHYTKRDLAGALLSYAEVVRVHPDSPEADYSRSQIRNILHHVVPKADLLASEVELALGYLRPAAGNPSSRES